MSTVHDCKPADNREVIRRRAFELADSGMLDDWEAVRRMLQAYFDHEHVEHVLGSPFCRLDLNQRCRAGRANGAKSHAGSGWRFEQDGIFQSTRELRISVPDSSLDAPARCGSKRAVSGRPRSPGLSPAIAALLADGRERSAAQLAQQLGAYPRDIQRTLQTMLAGGAVHVAGRAPRTGGGRAARLFAGGAQPGGDNTVTDVAPSWPRADPVALRAMDALARNG